MSKKREIIQKEKAERRRKMLDELHESKYARKARMKRLQKRGLAN